MFYKAFNILRGISIFQMNDVFKNVRGIVVLYKNFNSVKCEVNFFIMGDFLYDVLEKFKIKLVQYINFMHFMSK